MSGKKLLEFDCPACGNPIPRSDNEKMRCPWCRTLIVPQGYRKAREAKIFDGVKESDKNEKSKERKER